MTGITGADAVICLDSDDENHGNLSKYASLCPGQVNEKPCLNGESVDRGKQLIIECPICSRTFVSQTDLSLHVNWCITKEPETKEQKKSFHLKRRKENESGKTTRALESSEGQSTQPKELISDENAVPPARGDRRKNLKLSKKCAPDPAVNLVGHNSRESEAQIDERRRANLLGNHLKSDLSDSPMGSKLMDLPCDECSSTVECDSYKNLLESSGYVQIPLKETLQMAFSLLSSFQSDFSPISTRQLSQAVATESVSCVSAFPASDCQARPFPRRVDVAAFKIN
jgi:uncharacterized C2H2 Zn-finger protein